METLWLRRLVALGLYEKERKRVKTRVWKGKEGRTGKKGEESMEEEQGKKGNKSMLTPM